MKRLFIAINLPQNIKDKISGAVNKLGNYEAARFISPENWHLTISFLGYQPDETISPILAAIKETVKNFSCPVVEFEKMIFGPPGRPARMIWLTGTKETSKNLAVIKTKLEDELIKNGVRFGIENRGYSAHLTLVRFQSQEAELFKGELPKIENLSFTAPSLDLMESHLKRSGAEYEILTKMDFLKQT